MRTSSADTLWPGMRPPLCQSTWIASMASRLTCTVRSTGVPVLARMPETRNGLSSCSTNETEPSAVRDDDLVADLVAERLRHIGADHGVEQVAERLAAANARPAPWRYL